MLFLTVHCLQGTPLTLTVEKKGLKTPPTELHGKLRILLLRAIMTNATFSILVFK